MIISWVDNVDHTKVFVNSKTCRMLKTRENETICLTYGTLKVKKTLIIDNKLKDKCIGLSSQLTIDIFLPKEVLYDIKFEIKTIHIGPLIGMILTKSHKKLNNEKLKLEKERLKNYKQIKGVIFVSSQDLIDFKKKQIKGYYYTQYGQWKEANFPIPLALYNRTYMKKSFYMKLIKTTKIRVFNNCLMTKAKLWRLLKNDSTVNRYLPFTDILTNTRNFLEMTKKYNTIYLKPTNLSRGRGIITVHKTRYGFLAKDSMNRKMFISHRQELEGFIKELTNKHNYLMQQAVPYYYKKSLVDFRVYLQKDHTEDWDCSGIYCRVSKPKSIVTNLKHCHRILTLEDACQNIFKIEKEQMMEVRDEIIKAGKKVCKALEACGQNIGDVAIDIVVDHTLKIWVLEVQVSYAADKRLFHLPPGIYQKVWETPIRFAKALAGF